MSSSEHAASAPFLPFLALLSFLAPGCGSDAPGSGVREAPAGAEADPPAEPPGSTTPVSGRDRGRAGSTAPAQLLDSRAYDSERFGALHGEIRLSGEPPARFPIGARKNKDCTHHADVEHLSDVVVASDGKLAYAYVYLKSGYDEDAVPAPPAEPVRIDQRGCIYTPHVSAVQAGQKLLVANGDPTTHNVNVRAPRNNESGNVNMGANQPPLEFVFERREHEVSLKCDIHPWMEAWLHVEEHPWFAVSAADGTFSIPEVPPGEYVVEALHERFGKVRGRVTVEAGRSTGFALGFEAD